MDENKVPKRILSTLMTSLSAGVVPRTGAPYIAIGRKEETAALLSDFDKAADGGSSIRFIIGKYGSGKSFLIQLARGYALDKGFLCADADLSPERKLCGGNDSGLATCRELIKNLSSRTSPDGNALSQVISKWFASVSAKLASQGCTPDKPDHRERMSKEIFAVTDKLRENVGGFDFATALNAYFTGYSEGDDAKMNNAMRYLRCEYTTRTEARRDLGVGSIPDDSSWYDYIKLIACFARLVGYSGLIVFIDECVNLYKITNRVSRENNYEKLLSIFNDALSGRAEGLCFVFGGTPRFLEDDRRGLFSYEALRSRLADGRFDSAEYKNVMGPVIRLVRLTDNELFALISRITKLHGLNYGWEPPVTEEDMASFLKICLSRVGADSMITPREIARDYITVLNIMLQNPGVSFDKVVGETAAQSVSSADPDENEFDLGELVF